MGTDIHTSIEMSNDDTNWGNVFLSEPYYDFIEARSYDRFAFLCGIRNYGECPYIISEPRGLPSDITPYTMEECDSEWEWGHDHSYVTREELNEFDYTQEFYDKRGRETTTLGDFIGGEQWFGFLERLNRINAKHVRLVFCFDC